MIKKNIKIALLGLLTVGAPVFGASAVSGHNAKESAKALSNDKKSQLSYLQKVLAQSNDKLKQAGINLHGPQVEKALNDAQAASTAQRKQFGITQQMIDDANVALKAAGIK